MTDPIPVRGSKLNEFEFAEATGAEFYVEKDGAPRRVRGGDPDGLATLDENGQHPQEQAISPATPQRGDVGSIRSMADGAAVRIVCVGDSITYGELDTGGVAVTPWPARLQALLREYYGNANITVVNKGVSGSTVAQMLSRYADDVTAEAPDLVIFNGGTNDSREANAVTLDAYKADVKRYLNKLRPIPTVVWGITPRFKEQRSANGERVIEFYRQMLQSQAAARGLPYVNVFARLHDLYKSRAFASGFVSKDGSHYSEDGYRFIGDVIFAEAFANDDLFIRPGQFKDARGQWIVTEAADSAWGGALGNQDADALVVSNAVVQAYLFVEDWGESALVVHGTIDRTNGTGQQVVVENLSVAGATGTVNLTPKAAGVADWFAHDYAVPAVRLRPGLNNIKLSTTTSFRVTGFSVIRRPADGYLASFNPDSNDIHAAAFWTSARWKASTQAYELLRDGVLVVSNNAAGFIQPYFMLAPDPVATTSRWRFRATVYSGAAFHFGQQSSNAIDYMPVYGVALDGTNVVVSCRDYANTIRTVATVAKAFTGMANIKVDIKSGVTGWTLWIDDALIYTDTVPLSIGPVLVSAAADGRTYWNPPIKKGQAASDTGVLVGETWQTFSDDKLHIITDAAIEKTLAFV